MTKVLLTGGSGFIAAHILDQLLRKGYTVITTVRSEQKAKPIRDAYKDRGSQLEVVVVGDIARADAFDEVVRKPGIEVVLHTASPFHFKWTDAQKELVDPAVVGTTSILRAVKRSAPAVRRVVVTSSFAAVLDERHLDDGSHRFTEESWNPVGREHVDAASASPTTAYRISKTLAERAAWDFVAAEKPGFDLATVCPPVVFGPVVHHLASLEGINTSNERTVALVSGGWKGGIPATGPITVWVDVRDTALAHIRAMEKPEAGGRRLLTIGGRFKNRDIAEIARAKFPELGDKLPREDVEGGGAPAAGENFQYNNDATTKLLDMEWTSLESSITDLIRSLKEHGI